MKITIATLAIFGLLASVSYMDALAQSNDDMMDDTIMTNDTMTDDGMMASLEGDINIGVIYPLTGDLAERGTHRLAGAELGAADFNAYLESIGANWQIVLNVEDTETKPAASLEKAQLLNSKGVKLVIGPAGSGNVLSVKPYADRNNMLILSCCSTSPTLAIAGDSVFRLAPDDNVQGLALARLIESEGIEAVVPIWRQDDYGNNLAGLVRSNFESRGVVDDGIPYDPNLVDYSAAASLLAERVQVMADEYGADKVAVLIIGYDEVLNIVQGASNYDILEQVRWFAGESIAKESFILQDEIASEFVDTVSLTAFQIFENRGDKFSRVTQHIVDEFGVAPATYVYQSYDAVWLIGLSILEAGTDDPTFVKEVLPEVAAEYEGALGSTKLNSAGDLLPLDLAIFQVNDGEWTQEGRYSVQTNVIIPTTQVDGDINIGVIYPLTGDLAERGTHRLAGAELGAADFNAYLESIGANWQIVLNVEDTETKPAASLEKAQLLNSKGVKLVIGPAGSGNVLSVKPYADRNDMLILSCCSTSPTLAIAGDSVFRLAPDDSVQGLALAKLIESEGIEAVVPIWRQDDYGNNLAELVRSNFESRGVVDDGIPYDTNLADYSAAASLLAERVQAMADEYGADKVAVLIIGYDEVLNIVQGASNYDILEQVRWFAGESIAKESFILQDEIASEFVNTVELTAFQIFENRGDKFDRITQHIVDKFGVDPATYVYQSYDASWLIGLSILEAGTDDTDAIKATLPRVAFTYQGALGSTKLNDAGDLLPLDLAIWQVIDNEWVMQGTYSTATSTIVPAQ